MGDIEATARHNVTGLVPRQRTAHDDPESVRFTLLGELQAVKDDTVRPAPDPELRPLLALLLLRPGRPVHTDSIVHEVWPQGEPGDVRALVVQLRRHFEDAGLTASGRRLLACRHSSYLLKIEPGQVDVVVFRRLVAQGQEAFNAGHHERAAALLRSGLDLWSGPPLANVACGPVLTSYVLKLEQEFRTARHLRIQADIEAGRSGQLIGELRALVCADPLDEGSHAQLMQVLGMLGRRSEALTLYRGLRERLIDELGLEPCESVQAQHDRLIRGGLMVR